MPGRIPRVVRTPAVVLRHRRLGEADRILPLFTPRHGKVRAVAKGARRPSSKIAPHVELFSFSNLVLHRGRDLDVVSALEQVGEIVVLLVAVAAVSGLH